MLSIKEYKAMLKALDALDNEAHEDVFDHATVVALSAVKDVVLEFLVAEEIVEA